MKILLAGDSTVASYPQIEYPMCGWGGKLLLEMQGKIDVLNFAKCGATTKSYLNVGLWDMLLNEVLVGDIVGIQFGHNDQKPKNKVTEALYIGNLEKMIRDVRNKKATPFLCTPVERRTFEEGGFTPTLTRQAELTRFVGQEEDVSVIDLNTFTKDLFMQLGDMKSRELLTYFDAGKYPNYPEGNQDNTHFQEYGAKIIAAYVAQKLKKEFIFM